MILYLHLSTEKICFFVDTKCEIVMFIIKSSYSNIIFQYSNNLNRCNIKFIIHIKFCFKIVLNDGNYSLKI